MATIETYAEAFLDLTDTPSTFAGASLQAARVNVGETALEFFDLSAFNDASWLRLDASNDPITGNLDMSANVVPSADQTREIGGDTDRFIRSSARLGVFVGSSGLAGNGAPINGAGTRSFGQNPTGLMAGNQVEGGAGSATHYLIGGQFKGVCCIGNVASGNAGNALLSNRSGGSSLFGSAYTYGAGNATVEATAFGNFTTAYAYCVDNNHKFSNRGGGAFLAGYSRGAGTVNIDVTGAGAFCNVRPIASTASATLQVTVSNDGSFAQGSINANVAAMTTSMVSSAKGSFAQGFVVGALGNGGSMTSSGSGSLAQGSVRGAAMLASGAGSMAQGYANTNDITASGDGSMAHGVSTAGAITASALNSMQLGPGTNAQADSIQFGNAGLRIKGTTGAPSVLQNGDLWMNTTLRLRSAGVSWDFNTSPAYTPTNVVADRAFDANATTLAELADVVGTMIADLQAFGALG